MNTEIETSTPLTDASIDGVFSNPHYEYVNASFARSLERSLIQARQEAANARNGALDEAAGVAHNIIHAGFPSVKFEIEKSILSLKTK